MCSCIPVDQNVSLDPNARQKHKRVLVSLYDFVFKQDAGCKEMLWRVERQLLSVVVRELPRDSLWVKERL